MSFVERGVAAYHAGDIPEAVTCFDAALAGDVTDWKALVHLATIRHEAGQYGQAYALASQAARIHPSAEALSEVARALAGMLDPETALDVLKKAHEIDPTHVPTMNNAGMICISLGRHDEAWEWLSKAPPLEPDIERNKAFVHLFRQEWPEGWRAYDLGVGKGDRVERFTFLPTWNPGAPGPTVIYGEQGIGDEILFASCINDALKDMKGAVIETMPRLMGLFSRSFPEATVYGTRYDEFPIWNGEDPVNRISVAQLPGLYRKTTESFPGTPYLKACSARRAMVQGLFYNMPRKKRIGIAWKGGLPHTGAEDRTVDLKELMMAFAHIDAEFISLEHTLGDEKPEELGVHVFPFITDRNLDYDYTAALVRELDLVVTVPTAVAHLAGALGTPTLVMLNSRRQWRLGGPSVPWYRSVEVMKEWTPESVRDRINEVLNGAQQLRRA